MPATAINNPSVQPSTSSFCSTVKRVAFISAAFLAITSLGVYLGVVNPFQMSAMPWRVGIAIAVPAAITLIFWSVSAFLRKPEKKIPEASPEIKVASPVEKPAQNPEAPMFRRASKVQASPAVAKLFEVPEASAEAVNWDDSKNHSVGISVSQEAQELFQQLNEVKDNDNIIYSVCEGWLQGKSNDQIAEVIFHLDLAVAHALTLKRFSFPEKIVIEAILHILDEKGELMPLLKDAKEKDTLSPFIDHLNAQELKELRFQVSGQKSEDCSMISPIEYELFQQLQKLAQDGNGNLHTICKNWLDKMNFKKIFKSMYFLYLLPKAQNCFPLKVQGDKASLQEKFSFQGQNELATQEIISILRNDNKMISLLEQTKVKDLKNMVDDSSFMSYFSDEERKKIEELCSNQSDS